MDKKTFPGNGNIGQGDVRILCQSGDTFQAENQAEFDLVGWLVDVAPTVNEFNKSF